MKTEGNIYPAESALSGSKEAAAAAESRMENVARETLKIAECDGEVSGEEEGETERDICRGPRETESAKTNRGRVLSGGQFHRVRGEFERTIQQDKSRDKRATEETEKLKSIKKTENMTENKYLFISGKDRQNTQR